MMTRLLIHALTTDPNAPVRKAWRRGMCWDRGKEPPTAASGPSVYESPQHWRQYLIEGDQEVPYADGFRKRITFYFDCYFAMSHGALCWPILVAFILGG